MNNLLNENDYSKIKYRLFLLNSHVQAHWGKMDVAQMVNHCQKPLEIVLDKNQYNLKPNILAKLFYKKLMYNNRPLPHNLPTPKPFKVQEEKELDQERQKLEQLIDEFYKQKDKENFPKHPVFGKLTKEQWGQMQYKHLNHHLNQFGV